MTLGELQTVRGKIYTQYLAWIDAGCPMSYAISGRARTFVDHNFWQKQLNDLDIAIARLGSTGGCPVAQFREPD